MPPRITPKSYRPRASHRIMVGTLANPSACVASGAASSCYRCMKPSSWKQLGWPRHGNARRAKGGQGQNPSFRRNGAGCKPNIQVSREGRERNFLLTSPFIGSLTFAFTNQTARDVTSFGSFGAPIEARKDFAGTLSNLVKHSGTSKTAEY